MERKNNSIKIHNLYFKYNEKQGWILKKINMEIKEGEKVAIVGYNGAGKSTLIKLILRLYLPQKGYIELDDVKAEEYDLESYRNTFGVLFQDYQIYSTGVRENILMDKANMTKDEEDKVIESIKKSDVSEKIKNTPNKIDTILTKEFNNDGLVLSGGQQQKIALARVFVKERGILILDEPSSALDPISEDKLYKNIIKATQGKTVIMISHRLMMTKNADKIYYLENGEIVEQGNHEELIRLKGRYYNMFDIQAKKYI